MEPLLYKISMYILLEEIVNMKNMMMMSQNKRIIIVSKYIRDK
jgi:hypothetical protein